MRGRYAPSPTGDLHLGNGRTALLAWLQARSAGGAFVLRMEDLDRGRVREAARETQLLDLRWLGLDWDEGPDVGGPFAPYEQSARGGLYDEALGRLATLGATYPCFCSRREIAAAASAPHMEDEEGPPYPGTCRAREPDGRVGPFALRFRTPSGEVRFRDLVQGEQRFAPADAVGDFVVKRKDGVAAYQLAVVVDDAAMEITHVLRGADLLSSTARQLLLYRALGLRPPEFAHVPLVLGPDGERLAKRHAALSLRELRLRGEDPLKVVGWMAATAGLVEAGARVSAPELIPRFDPESLRNGGRDTGIPAEWVPRPA